MALKAFAVKKISTKNPEGDILPQFAPGQWQVSAAWLESLPVQEISGDEWFERECSWYWNGTEFYPEGVSLLPGEVGHDQQARYTVVQED